MAHAAKPGHGDPEREPAPRVRLGALDLEAHLRDPARKQAFVTPMFDVIAPKYDAFTRWFSFGMDAVWKRSAIHAASRPLGEGAAVQRALDLAAGTGDLAIGIARALPSARVTAIDASARMIEAANARLLSTAGDVPSRITTMVGDMTSTGLPDASMDVITAGYGLRNVPDATQAIAEMRRVLRRDGRLVLLDFYRPESQVWRALFLGYLQLAGNAVGWLWHRDPVVYGYIARSIEHFMSWQAMSALLTQHGFRVVHVERHLLGGVALHEAIAD
jgi:demethylmenaquinone methyltransferase/2-methoxy-6-polyprenyl-1,4-benzoquinol methylase